jgi:hypothetical protein
MVLYAQRLGLEAYRDGLECLQQQVHCYLAAINAFRLIDGNYAWLEHNPRELYDTQWAQHNPMSPKRKRQDEFGDHYDYVADQQDEDPS